MIFQDRGSAGFVVPLSFQVLVRPECGTCSKRPGSELRVLSTLMRLMQLGEKELEGQTVFAFVRMRACMRVCVCVLAFCSWMPVCVQLHTQDWLATSHVLLS